MLSIQRMVVNRYSRDHVTGPATPPPDILERIDGQGSTHPGVHGPSYNPVAPHVLDRAQIQLAPARPVLGDIGQPHDVGSIGMEVAAHEVIRRGPAGGLARAVAARDRGADPMLRTDAPHATPRAYSPSPINRYPILTDRPRESHEPARAASPPHAMTWTRDWPAMWNTPASRNPAPARPARPAWQGDQLRDAPPAV
jgi:hypothetical protein